MRYIVGVDEAGRGPLAGPVSVGIVALPYERGVWKNFEKLKDSKKLRPQLRREWFEFIKNDPEIEYAVSLVGSEMIDTEGIVPAIKTALCAALKRLNLDPEECHIVLDGGLRAPVKYTSQETIIKGDALHPAIALASIVAKETRDAQMERFGEKYPEYNFEGHKGYGTKEHYKALHAHGLCPIHRKTFVHLK